MSMRVSGSSGGVAVCGFCGGVCARTLETWPDSSNTVTTATLMRSAATPDVLIIGLLQVGSCLRTRRAARLHSPFPLWLERSVRRLLRQQCALLANVRLG